LIDVETLEASSRGLTTPPPRWMGDAVRADLPALRGGSRFVVRGMMILLGPLVKVEGLERLGATSDPVVFALNHNNTVESLLAPSALVYSRGGRMVHFVIDWMYAHLPLLGWALRLCDPVLVYRKPAKFRWGESLRRERLGDSVVEGCLAKLARGGSVGIFPEGRRNADPGRLLRGRSGLGEIVLRSGVPVIPVGIHYPAAARLGRVPHLGRMILRVGEPMYFAAQCEQAQAGDPRAVRKAARQVVDRVMGALEELSGKAYSVRRSEAVMRSEVTVTKVLTEEHRTQALAVIEAVYLHEKQWIESSDAEIPPDIASSEKFSWFLVAIAGEPAGVIRLVYDPPLEMPAEYGVRLEPNIDLEGLKRNGRFVDIGRFMIIPRHRRNIRVVLKLMRGAIVEVVGRGYTHFLTDVFEDDPHSPLKFHTQVLGFERIGTHRQGELACASARIILILDIARAYQRLKRRQNKVWKELGEGVRDVMERLFARSSV
jgi:1-acyl-sn-glycerol-3-phosphate acyltransferase